MSEKHVIDWLSTHDNAGIEYYLDIDETSVVNGVAVGKCDPSVGFEFPRLGVRTTCRRWGTGSRPIMNFVSIAAEKGYTAIDETFFNRRSIDIEAFIRVGLHPFSMNYHIRFTSADAVNL